MPKTSESPFYLYWDKALLLILATVALYVVLTQVVSSPLHSKDSGGQRLGPQEIVEQISSKADALRTSLGRSVPPPSDQPRTVEKVRQYLEVATGQRSSNPLTPAIPDELIQAKTATPTVLTPGNVRAQGGIGIMASATTSRTPPTSTRAPAKMYWVTVAADFPFRKQYLAFAGIEPRVDEQHRLDEEDQYFLFARLELERQQLQPDGSWSEPQSVDPYQTYQETRPKIVQALSQLYSLPLGYDQKDLNNRDALRQWLNQSGFQEFIVRPEFLPLDGFEQWDWPQEPPETSDEQTTRRILAGAIPSDTAPIYIKVDKPATRDLLLPRRPDMPGAYGPAPGAFPGAFRELPFGLPSAPVARIRPTRTSRASRNRVTLPQNYRLEDAPDSIPIWVHDASVEPAVTYRYRLRVSLFNPLCGSERAERSVRRQGWLSGQWSAWSEPVKTLQDRYFFFTGVSSPIASKPSRAKLQLYAWDNGYWFKMSVLLREGQAIGAPKEVPDPDPAALADTDTRRRADSTALRPARPGRTLAEPPSRPARIKVDFTTGWTVLEFNPNIQVERPVADKPDEFQTVDTHELVVENTETGQTDKRYSDLDKDDPQKQALGERIKRQKEALRPATPPPPRPERRRPVPRDRRRGVRPPPGAFGLPLPWR